MVLRSELAGFEPCTVEELKGLARVALETLGGDPTVPTLPGFPPTVLAAREIPTRRAALLDLLNGLLSSEKVVRRLYAALGEVEQAAVQEAAQDPRGRFDPALFRAKYGALPDLGRQRSGYAARRDPVPVLRLLLPQGSAIPPVALEHLVALVPEPPATRPETISELPDALPTRGAQSPTSVVISKTEEPALRDVHAVLRLVEAGLLRVGSKGRVTKAAATSVYDVLAAGDFYARDIDTTRALESHDPHVGPLGIRPFAWALLLQAGKLARIARGRLELTRAGRLALSSPAPLVLKTLWNAWIGTDVLHELQRVELVKGQRSRSRPLGPAAHGRDALAECLSDVPEGEWITIPALLRFMAACGLTLGVVRDLFSDRKVCPVSMA